MMRLLSQALFAVLAMAAGWWLFSVLGLVHQAGFTSLFQDQWTLYEVYLTEPFPASVMVPFNGHRHVFPGIIYLADLWLNDGRQHLILWTGMSLGIASLGLLVWVILRSDAPPAVKGVQLVVAVAGFFWFVNARTFLHGNETAHAYPVTLSLLLGGLLLFARSRIPGLLAAFTIASGLGLIAILSFGSGVAVVPAWIAVAMALRWPVRSLAGLLLAFGMLAVIYLLLLPAGHQATASTGVSVQTLRAALVVLGSPIGYMLSGRSAPALVHEAAAILGLIGYATTLLALLHAWRSARPVNRVVKLALVLMCFGAAVAMLIAYGRHNYFQRLPDQQFADRYQVWVTLFWAGLLIHTVEMTRPVRWAQAAAASVALLICVRLWTTQHSFEIWGQLVNRSLESSASGMLLGIHDDERYRASNNLPIEQIYRTLDLLRSQRKELFADPAARFPGARLAEIAQIGEPQPGIGRVQIDTILQDSKTGEQAVRISGWTFDNYRGKPAEHVVVTLDGTVVGLAKPATRERAIARKYGLDSNAPLGFAGYIRDYNPEQRYQLFAVNREMAFLFGEL